MADYLEKLNNVIITGPTGVLGTALVKKMASLNIETYVICHPGSKRSKNILIQPCIHKVDCDMNEIRLLPKLINKNVDAFFHFAWLGTADPKNRMNMHLQTMNIAYTLDAVEAAREMGCKVFIGAGSQAEYGRIDGVMHSDSPCHPISGYGMAKLCAGQMTRTLCKEFGIRHIWPRIVSVYGPNDGAKTLVSTVIRTLKKGESPKLTAGEQIWDYLYSADAAEALYLMAEHGKDGAVYVLGSGNARPLKEFMKDIWDAVNKDIPLQLGAIPYLPDQAMHLEADISSITEDTGWRPTTEFKVGIMQILIHYD